MSGINKNYSVFGFEKEAVPGSVETIVQADVINCQDGVSIGKNPNVAPRNVMRDDVQVLAPKVGGLSSPVTIPTEIKGSGTAGSLYDPFDDIMAAGGLAGVADAGFAVRYAADPDLSTHEPGTAKWFVDGKQITAAGVAGNITFNIPAGETGKLNFEGQGILASDGDLAVLTAASDDPEPPVFINNDFWLLEHHATTEDDLDGDGELLRGDAGFGERLEKTIVQGATSQKVMAVGVWLKKIGTPASETNGFWVTIEGDAAGDPDGTPIANGTSAFLATTGISDTDWELYLMVFGSFGNRPTLTNGTTYHFELQGDWTQADANCISVDTDVVAAPAQNTQEYDGAAWNAVSLENASMIILVAPDVENFFDDFTLNMNNEFSLVKDPNATQGWRFAKVRGRGDGIKANVTPLEKLDAEQDFWNELTSASDMFAVATLGDTAGNITQFIMRHAKITDGITFEDREKEVAVPLELHLRNTTDLEIVQT